MNPSQRQFIIGLIQNFFSDRPKQSVADWCCENLRFDEPGNNGPFSLAGREYCREVLNDWSDPNVTDHVEVFGSQTSKTGSIMGGAAWTIVNEPSRIVWVMPTRDTVRKFSRTRWMSLIRASHIFKALIPTGSKRHEFSTLEQQIGSSVIDLLWSNSPAALASVPARIVILDEVDKFNEGGTKETNAVDLAQQRTKSFGTPKRIKASTPTIVEGLVWQEFLKTDQRRRFVPCPECKKFLIFAWSDNFTVFKKLGCEAFVKWDKEAKRDNGTWDFDRVEKSARFECPFCGCHIRDGHKTRMDRDGEWRPTAVAARGYRGRQLSSLYAASPETAIGKLAVKFLQAKAGLLGLQGFINGDLAEPFESQDRAVERVELIVRSDEPLPSEGFKALTFDVQETAPHLPYIVRIWQPGITRCIEKGAVMGYDELRAIQQKHAIPDNHVCGDSGDDTQTVYEQCARFGNLKLTQQRRTNGQPPLHIGWIPSKGIATDGWRDAKSKSKSVIHLQPLERLVGGRVIAMPLLEFSDRSCKDILDRLRKSKVNGIRWEVVESVSDEEYWRHMDGEILKKFFDRKTGRTKEEWIRRSRWWPNHWLDCEKLQIVIALFHRWISETAK